MEREGSEEEEEEESRNVTDISDKGRILFFFFPKMTSNHEPKKVCLYLLLKPPFAFALLGMFCLFKMSELRQKTFPFPAGLSESSGSSSSSSSTGVQAQLCSSVRAGQQRSA